MKFAQSTFLRMFAGILLSTPVFAKATLMNVDDIKFSMIPGFFGVYSATVEGDALNGPHHAFMKFDPGFSAPMHYHNADHYVAVLKGTMIFTVGGVEYKLPAGSYFSFVNKEPHATKCEMGSECLLFLDARGSWDIVTDATE